MILFSKTLNGKIFFSMEECAILCHSATKRKYHRNCVVYLLAILCHKVSTVPQ
nr:MAG TPA: hypothetical protein [Bacteriophage sp.]